MKKFEKVRVDTAPKNSFEEGTNQAWLKMNLDERFGLLKSLLLEGFTDEQLKGFSQAGDIDDIKSGEVVGRLIAAYDPDKKVLTVKEYKRTRGIMTA